MQVDYAPATIAGASTGMPPPPDMAEISEPEEEEEETVQEDAAAEANAEVKEKKKRIMKQRQSLAEKQPGTTIFPISRIKRIIRADKELDMMTSEATFMVSVAAEYFIKHFMEEGYTKARLEKRRIVNYKDMAAVVARSQDFDFLKDVVPAPIPISEALQLRKQKMALDENPTLHDDIVPSDPRDLADQLPPLTISTNPLFPNAIVKKPPNTHSKGPAAAAKAAAVKEKEKAKDAPADRVEASKGPSTPRLVTGKNAPSTPHSLTTRGSARRSIVPAEAESMELDSTAQNGASEVAVSVEEDDRMDQD
ncbi:histone-fold-containing protein [Naematelia encephala]|uniref:Histone-fold-containing protein n=1 Tax=Naematelia encephala TaxID=71784 RepID=A0A1Y2BAU9_9TREE|nr:histone-fold-containing protein [Naematelia encephala]